MQSEGQKGYYRGYIAACKRMAQEAETDGERKRAETALREAREAARLVAAAVEVSDAA